MNISLEICYLLEVGKAPNFIGRPGAAPKVFGPARDPAPKVFGPARPGPKSFWGRPGPKMARKMGRKRAEKQAKNLWKKG